MTEELQSTPTTTSKSSVVCLSRLPKEFEEKEIKQFFSQFGTVKRLRLSRNKKTGASKHYAFLEFETAEVASIVANSMNNYILFGHKLSCTVMPSEQIHETLWKGANRKYHITPTPREFEKKERTEIETRVYLKKRMESNEKLHAKLESMGIQYDYLNQMHKQDEEALHEEKKEEKKEEPKPIPKSTESGKGIRIVKRLSKQAKKLGH